MSRKLCTPTNAELAHVGNGVLQLHGSLSEGQRPPSGGVETDSAGVAVEAEHIQNHANDIGGTKRGTYALDTSVQITAGTLGGQPALQALRATAPPSAPPR